MPIAVERDSRCIGPRRVDSRLRSQWCLGREYRRGGDLFAPHLVLVEATNILRRLERAHQLNETEAAAARLDIVRLTIGLVPFEPFTDRVWELRSNLTSYDAWYVAVAEALDLPLATLDMRLSRASGPSCRFMLPD
ncbi:MAG: type II toxin-antitoxin system VapC family toxin [Gammaproteobacteria bacterium]|nr:type II toxin-antitoxin system VapC family toxin [Gammaproteobacteria bacterium]